MGSEKQERLPAKLFTMTYHSLLSLSVVCTGRRQSPSAV